MGLCVKLVLVLLTVIQTIWARGMFRDRIPNGYSVPHPCSRGQVWEAVGHMGPHYVRGKNGFGQSFVGGGRVWNRGLCMRDSDGDGLTNGQELGDPNCRWRPGQTPEMEAIGHPGICEPDRPTCRRRFSFSECPHRGRGRGGPGGVGRGQGGDGSADPPRRPPFGSNEHPQALLSKQLTGQLPPGSPVVGGFSQSPAPRPMDATSMSVQGGSRFAGSDRMGAGDTPSLDMFYQNLDQTNVQGTGRFRMDSGMTSGMAPGMSMSSGMTSGMGSGGMTSGMMMPAFSSFGSLPSIQSQVQARFRQERMGMPGSSGMAFGTFGSDGPGMSSTFGSGGTFAPMSPMAPFMSMGMGRGSMMSGMRFGYPTF